MRKTLFAALLPLLCLAAGPPQADEDGPLGRHGALLLPKSDPEPGKLRVRFMGVSTLLFEEDGKSILIDGFFSRPKNLVGIIKPKDDRIQDALGKADVRELLAVIVAQSHYDHALDSATIAKARCATLVGAASTISLGRAAGIGEGKLQPVAGGERFDSEFKPFKLEVLKARHGFPNLFQGKFDAVEKMPNRVWEFRGDATFSFLVGHGDFTMLVHPGSNYRRDRKRGGRPGDTKPVKADVVFLGIGVLGWRSEHFIEKYWDAVVRSSGACLVIPIHWDKFRRPLDKGLVPAPGFSRAMKLIKKRAKADGRTLRLMPLYDPVDIGAAVAEAKTNVGRDGKSCEAQSAAT
jgi:L-ascorbate metabolism protein UlaG (beta-lactamase superfamily)